MDNRFRRLPPRIEPLYQTHDVSDPPPLPEVRETVGLTPAGQVADFERFASAIARDSDQPGPAPFVHNPVQQRRRGRVLAALYIAVALGIVTVAFVMHVR